MSRTWQVQVAKARFSELLERSLTEGSQIVTRRGVETAVLVPIDQWRRLERQAKPDIKELLLAPEARTDALTPPRPGHCHRASPEFDQGRDTAVSVLDPFEPTPKTPAAPAENPPAPTEPA